MRSTAVLLAAAAALALSPTAASARGVQPAPPEPVAEDPCAQVDGQVPLLCQSGSGQPAQQPGLLPVTGPGPYAEGAVLLLLAGGGVLLVRRRWLPRARVS